MRWTVRLALMAAFLPGCAGLDQATGPGEPGRIPFEGTAASPKLAAKPLPELKLGAVPKLTDLLIPEAAANADKAQPEIATRFEKPKPAATPVSVSLPAPEPVQPTRTERLPKLEAPGSLPAPPASPAQSVAPDPSLPALPLPSPEPAKPEPPTPVAPPTTSLLPPPALPSVEAAPAPAPPKAEQPSLALAPVTPKAPIATKAVVAEGKPVASVGNEVIRLPELTSAIKSRLTELPRGETPSRREVMALAKTVLKGMIIRSLVMQEARDLLGGADRVELVIEECEKRWTEDELPRILAREKVDNEVDLRDRLWKHGATPGTARDEFITRALALELMRRDGTCNRLETYLDRVRSRRPITSIMNQSELAAAGRTEAERESKSNAEHAPQ